MSLQDAENFLFFCSKDTNKKIKNMMKNIDSKFESDEAKIYYISERAKEFGYEFTPKELSDTLNRSKNNIAFKIKNTANKAKKLWESLW